MFSVKRRYRNQLELEAQFEIEDEAWGYILLEYPLATYVPDWDLFEVGDLVIEIWENE